MFRVEETCKFVPGSGNVSCPTHLGNDRRFGFRETSRHNMPGTEASAVCEGVLQGLCLGFKSYDCDCDYDDD